MIVNDFNPWLSKTSIAKGANWGAELTASLANARAGIICLTPSNLREPWILFEAGAIAKTVAQKPLACTLLIGLKSSDLAAGPLTLFQDTKLTRDDLLQLVKTLNYALEKDALKEAQVEKAFDLVWPKLEERLAKLPADEPTDRPERSQGEMIEEILDTVRSASQDDAVLLNWIARGIQDISTKLPNVVIGNTFPQFGLAGIAPLSSLVNPQPGPLGTGVGYIMSTQGNVPAGVQPKSSAAVAVAVPFLHRRKRQSENARRSCGSQPLPTAMP